jgi:hypothetical protein
MSCYIVASCYIHGSAPKLCLASRLIGRVDGDLATSSTASLGGEAGAGDVAGAGGKRQRAAGEGSWSTVALHCSGISTFSSHR